MTYFSPAPLFLADLIIIILTLGEPVNETAQTLATTSQSTLPAPRPAPTPKLVHLPCGGSMSMLTREQCTQLFGCSHGELGRLLCRKQAPLPIRVEGTILFFVDECLNMQAQVQRTLDRWRHR
jgi:hypothetical protein